MTLKTISKFIKYKNLCILIVFLLFACSHFSKDSYLRNFTELIEKVEKNYSSYSDEDWKKSDEKYQAYTHEYYNKFESELTSDDQKLVGKLKTKYLIVKSKYEMKNFGEQIKDGISQIKGAIDEVFNEDNVDQIKGALNEVLDRKK